MSENSYSLAADYEYDALNRLISVTDETGKNFIAKNKSYYRLHTNNCADFVYEILTSQLPPISESVYIPYDLIDRLERGYNQNGITTWKFNWVISLLKFFNQVP